jgi:hypothetical protein
MNHYNTDNNIAGSANKEKIVLPKATLTLIKKNTIRINIHEEVELNSFDILQINKAKNELANGHKHVVLFVPCEFGTITPEARKTSASEEVNRNAIAKAIVVQHLANRLIANFFIMVDRPPAPTRIFSEEKDALKWLRVMQNNYSRQKKFHMQ